MEVETEEHDRYRSARDGDQFLTSFECDLCHFRNCCQRNPREGDSKDQWTLLCIRRANLDAFWSREISTVKANLSRLRRDVTESMATTSILHPVPAFGNRRVEDRVGMTSAIHLLGASLRKGRYGPNLQWDTCRHTSTWYHNAWDAGANYQPVSFLGLDNTKTLFSNCPTMGKWYYQFSLGVKHRMGVLRFQNEPLTPQIIHAMDTLVSEEWALAPDDRRAELEDVMCYTIFTFCNALRGEEVPLITLKGMLEFWDQTALDTEPYIMTTLYGRFKGEMVDRYHCLPIPDDTASKLPARKWISSKVNREISKGRKGGPFFLNSKGRRAKMSDFNEEFRRLLDQVKESRVDGSRRLRFKNVIPEAATPDMYSLWRSGRRGATLAVTGKVPDSVITLYNRWRTVESSRGAGATGLGMQQTYLHVKASLPKLRMYGKAL